MLIKYSIISKDLSLVDSDIPCSILAEKQVITENFTKNDEINLLSSYTHGKKFQPFSKRTKSSTTANHSPGL